MKNKSKALVLFSGGLDSILAVKLLKEQKIDVTGICFTSYFFDSSDIANKWANKLNIRLKICDISEEMLKIIKNPVYGYGKNMNPCIDCKILMIKKAKKFLWKGTKKSEWIYQKKFLATGDVLGERPFSQNKNALELIEKKSGVESYLLRPLSAKLLKETIPEKEKWIDREKLKDFQGRSRKRQIALAREWKIKNYPTPAGGCLLTDPSFSVRVRELIKKWPNCNIDDIALLKVGRHFWEGSIKIIVGRNEGENIMIEKLKRKGDIILKPKTFKGPTILIRRKEKELDSDELLESLKMAKNLMIRYSSQLSS